LTVRFSANGKREDELAVRTSGAVSTNAGHEVLYAGEVIGTLAGGANGAALVVGLLFDSLIQPRH
jgi:hypothetical protein